MIGSAYLFHRYEGFAYGVAVRVERGWALLGEVEKLVPLSALRFVSLSFAASPAPPGCEVTIAGVANEVVTACAAEANADARGGWVTHCATATFDASAAPRTLRFGGK